MTLVMKGATPGPTTTIEHLVKQLMTGCESAIAMH
tara:strand:- start:451 stop:555 length:105 start_codon:yes stop_codon:yes gene_type:complete